MQVASMNRYRLGGRAGNSCDIDTIRYDTIGEFNVDSKAECAQLNLTHVAWLI